MPSSTPWRARVFASAQLHRSPSPPVRHEIEPLSPEPLLPLTSTTTEQPRFQFSAQQSFSQGLGLSSDTFDSPAANFGHSGYRGPAMNQKQGVTFDGRTPGEWSSQNGESRPHGEISREGYNSRQYDRSRKHHRNGSSIDELADAALASPYIPQQSPVAAQNRWSPFRQSNGFNRANADRPSKRARSEMLPSHQINHYESRPATSHIGMPNESTREDDAALLLHFVNSHKSPPQSRYAAPVQQNGVQRPSFKRWSESSTDSETHQTKWRRPSPPIFTHVHPAAPAVEQALAESPTLLCDASDQQDSATKVEGMVMTALEEGNSPPNDEPHIAAEDVQDTLTTDSDPTNFVTEAFPAVTPESSPQHEKKPKRIKPTTEQTFCNICHSMQASNNSSEDDGWINCNGCRTWKHYSCAGFKDKKEVLTVDKYFCTDCQSKHGPTTFVRKSSRARTAIDYAGLNEGIVQGSSEAPGHIYIQPIKEGTIKLDLDTYARIRPEYATTEFFEKTDGMKEPIVIPAEWNARFGAALGTQELSSEQEESIGAGGELFLQNVDSAPFGLEEVLDCDQDRLGMIMPRDLTVRQVSELYGSNESLGVIDVQSQTQGEKKWNLRKWADYYESNDVDKIVRNVISLEVSQSKLGRLIRRPKYVRDIDLQDSVWPQESQYGTDFPKVQFYCLMSVADCYTDFHIDFGGSSVYYHILKGNKTFFFIRPEDKNLKKYEDWCNSEHQSTTWLGDLCGECVRVDLSQGDTMLIPAGWIHSVWTPTDSLVIGGNFLTRLNYEMQIKVANIERDTKVARQFRYPYFQKIMWYAALKYLEEDPVPEEVMDDFTFDHEHVYRRADPVWHELGELQNEHEPGEAGYNARYYSRKEIEGLPALRDYLYRTALIAGGFHVPGGVTVEAGRAVKRSIPKGIGDAMDVIKTFGIWCAWKIGSVVAPEWTRPDARSTTKLLEKQVKSNLSKKHEVIRTPPERVSERVANQVENQRLSMERNATPIKVSEMSPPRGDGQVDGLPTTTPKSSGLGPKRVACDPCRKRRIRCRHKEEIETPSNMNALFDYRPRAPSNVSLDGQSAFLLSNYDGQISPNGAYPNLNGASTFTSPLMNSTSIPNMPSEHSAESLASAALMASHMTTKKGRSKACEECRKSKRRCIHDDQGRVDPTKAAEPAKPRGSGPAKRPSRPGDELKGGVVKKQKLESGDHGYDSYNSLAGQAQAALADLDPNEAGDYTNVIDPSLMPEQALPRSVPTGPSAAGIPDFSETFKRLQAATKSLNATTHQAAARQIHSAPLPPETAPLDPALSNGVPQQPTIVQPPHPGYSAFKPEETTTSLNSATNESGAASLASPPNSLPLEEDYSHMNGEHQVANSIEHATEIIDPALASMHTPNTNSRHSSRQPKQQDLTSIAAAAVTVAKPAEVRNDNGFHTSTPDASLAHPNGLKYELPRESLLMQPAGTSPEARRESSGSRPGSLGRTSFSYDGVDQESLRLIQALQQEDAGLRRRAGTRT